MQGLLVVDVQRDVMSACADAGAVVSRIAGLVERARAVGVPVTWVQHHDEDLERGSDGWQIVPDLVPAEGEPIVHKGYGDSFAETDLADRLAGGSGAGAVAQPRRALGRLARSGGPAGVGGGALRGLRAGVSRRAAPGMRRPGRRRPACAWR